MVASVFGQVTVGAPGPGSVMAPASQLVAAGEGECLLYNSDPANTIWLCGTNSYNSQDAGTSNVTPLGPRASVVFDGTSDVYGVCNPGDSAVCFIYPTATSFVPSFPPTLVYNLPASPTAVAAEGSFQTGIISTQGFQSYNISFLAYDDAQSTATAALTSQLLIQWYEDPAGQFPIYSERWYGWLGATLAGSSPMYGRGPQAGPYFSITIFNSGGVGNIQIESMNIWGSNAAIAQSDWRQVPPANIRSGDSLVTPLPGAFGDDCILASWNNLNPGASMSLWQPLPLAPGPVWMRFQSNVALNNDFIVGFAATLQNGGIAFGTSALNVLVNVPNTPNAEFEAQFIAPRSPLYVAVRSTSTAPALEFQMVTKPPGT